MSADKKDCEPLVFYAAPESEIRVQWKVLIVDDEPAIHGVTRMVLNGLRFRERSLAFLSAYDSIEAQKILAEHDDIALILLDVVMETDDAGLKLVKHIRDVLHNDLVRIILRTGQAGQAPEREVILDYDINDYKEKTELTAQKLSTAVIAALRGYLALIAVAAHNRELESKVNERTAELQLANARLKQSLAALELGERAGRRVQFKLLPQQPWRFGEYLFSHLLMPSEFMSGDFVDYFAIDDGRVGFYIADVSGHGVASAFVTVYLKRFFSTVKEAHKHHQASAIADPALLLSQLNEELLAEKMGKHIAIFYAVLDAPTGTLCYANAGAVPYPLLVDEDGARYLESKSTPVGLFQASRYENQTLQLPARFRLLMCSDGVLEVLPEASNDARLQRLAQFVSLNTDSLDAIRDCLEISKTAQLPDDLTMLLIARSPVALSS